MAQADLHEQLKPSTYLMSVQNGIEVEKRAQSSRVGGWESFWERLCCLFLGGRARSVGLVWVRSDDGTWDYIRDEVRA